MSPQMKRWSRLFFGALLICLSIAAGGIGLRMLRAAALLCGMTNAAPPRIVSLYQKASSHDPIVSDFWIQGRDGPLKMRMMTPKGLPDAPMIVLVHGFVREGPMNYRIAMLAEGLCRSGLRVAMPYIDSEEKFHISSEAVDKVDDAIRWSALSSREKISLFGISYSGGLVISAAANPQYADYVKLVFCVSGYNSIERVGEYYIHDRIEGPDSQPYGGYAPTGSLVGMAWQYLDELAPPEDVNPLSAQLRAILNGASLTDPGSLNARQRAELDDLVNAKSEEMRARYRAVLQRHRAEMAYISPRGKLSGVHASLYVLHGRVDDLIPSEEAEWTRAEAAHNRNARVVITPWMHHASLAANATFWEKMRVVHFISEMLDQALRRAPLGSAMH